ncbi:DUF6259 domain-containing protein [Anaerobaca lacustris]|uniref:DUF6259 domain-containing protein n=1 Tax=Anaerobaca lacustris TaxID=3044600 RepID=A0AAW6TTP1_9BACT|nr:DUF6259 domain-containing protein [Sedimentisphaerales bacterium M17dextr]
MDRRNFLKAAGSSVALSGAVSSWAGPASVETPPGGTSRNHEVSIQVRDGVLFIDTATQTAVMEKGVLTSLKSKRSGEVFVRKSDVPSAALQLLYRGGETVSVDESKFGAIETHSLSDHRAEVVFHSWDADGVLTVSVEPQTGDILVEPAAYSSRGGVLACRWNLTGLRSDLKLVAPFFQGVKLPLDDSLIKDSHWEWPFFWEAGLAILQAEQGGFWVHTQDNRYRYKALKVGTRTDAMRLGFDTQAYGPIDNNLSAGGLTWRINVFDGDWQEPATRYRQWLWQAYDLEAERARRAPWVRDVRFAVSWCPTDEAILEALAQELNPKTVLLHIPNWRTDPYDENYPTYVPSETAKAFIRKGRALGFHMMPHFNAIDMDPSNPAYAHVRDFQYRGIERYDLRGWSWYRGRGLGVPESNAALLANRDKKVMVKVHPGLSMWRSILGRAIRQATDDLATDAAFIDVTLVSHNLHNCFVEATTPTEGMHKLIRHVAALGRGLVVSGEGLNEITMQGQSFAQVHLFKSWHQSIDGLERTGGCDLNAFLFDGLCRAFGYANLGGRDADQELRMRMHLEHGAIPTVTIRSAREILSPNAAVRRMLDRAKGSPLP